jgi:putative ABC transport system permease protein
VDAGRELTSQAQRPPRLAEALLRGVLPGGTRGLSIIGDLAEEYRARASRRHVARLWYWRQALSLAFMYTADPRRFRLRRGSPMFDLSSDLTSSIRNVLRSPGTSLTIVATLALAVAATTIGFSFADFAILRGMPVDDTRRVVDLRGVDPRQGNTRARLSLPNAFDIRDRMTTLERVAAFQNARATLIEHGTPTSLDVVRTTSDFFAVMGQQPFLGRLFRDEDSRPGAPPVVAMAHHYWKQVLAEDPSIVGKTLMLGTTPHTVVGVVSPEMEIGNLSVIDLWIAIPFEPTGTRADRAYNVVARLKGAASFATAAAEIDAISTGLAADHPDVNKGWRWRMQPINAAMAGQTFWLVIALFILAMTLIMAIASANVANLILVRATARRREMAVRLALGAGRFRVARQLGLEGLLLSMASGAAALPLAELGLRAIRAVDAEPALRQMTIDAHEVTFVAALVVLGPVVFSLAPALVALRGDLHGVLQAGGLRVIGAGSRLRATLVVMQVALASMLLVVAGLALRSQVRLANLDIGVRLERAVTFRAAFDPQEYSTSASVIGVREALVTRLAAIPGVLSAHVADALPVLSDGRLVSLEIDGQPPAPDGDKPVALQIGVDSTLLAAIGVPLRAGRWLTADDLRRNAPVALLGRAAAAKYFGDAERAIGRRINAVDRGVSHTYEIVGVTADVLTRDLEIGPQPQLWTPLGDAREIRFVLTTAGDESAVAPAVRRAAAEVAPMVPLDGLEPYRASYRRSRASDYIIIGIFTSFALLAMVLAATGLYGVISFTVSQRSSEFGTRFALGAQVRDVMGLVLGQALRLVFTGLAIGLGAGILLARAMQAALFDVTPFDPANLATVAGLLIVVTIIASVVPALKAARVDIVQAIRAE